MARSSTLYSRGSSSWLRPGPFTPETQVSCCDVGTSWSLQILRGPLIYHIQPKPDNLIPLVGYVSFSTGLTDHALGPAAPPMNQEIAALMGAGSSLIHPGSWRRPRLHPIQFGEKNTLPVHFWHGLVKSKSGNEKNMPKYPAKNNCTPQEHVA